MSRTLRIALGQFFVQKTADENLKICRDLITRAEAGGAKLLVLPEGIIARNPADHDWTSIYAENVDGPFVTGLCEATRGLDVTVVGTVHIRVPGEERVENDLVVIHQGEVKLVYTKLHLYDAFSALESANVVPGNVVPPVLEIGPFRAGFMTCYDVRFPELARRLVLDGATLLVLPAAWVRGPLKESHWDICVRARALENTCYVAAVSECGPVNIGSSKVVDPLGVVVAQAGPSDELLFADIDADRVDAVRRTLPVLENRRFGRPELR